MKNSLTILLVIAHFCAAAAELVIHPSPTTKPQCVSQEITYTVTSPTGPLPSCTFTWSVSGGVFKTGINTGPSVVVIWNDLPGTGTLSVTANACSPSSENGSSKSVTYTRHSVFGQNFPSGACNTSVDVPICSSDPVFLCVNRMYITNTGGAGEPPQREVDAYKFSIPAGWRHIDSNVTGPATVTLPVNQIVLQPLGAEGGSLTVTASVKNSCQNALDSNPVTIAINRTPPVTIVAPAGFPGARCGLTTPLTFSVTSLSCASSFEWTIPVGWSGSSTTNSIIVTPNGSSGGNLSVLMQLSTGASLTKTYTIPFLNEAPTPTISRSSNQSEICSGESWTVTCTPPAGYPLDYGFQWYTTGGLLINGLSTSSAAPLATTSNSITLSAPPSAYGNAYVHTRLATTGCNPSPYAHFQLQVGPYNSSQFSISGPTLLCPNTTESYISTLIDPSITEYQWSWSGVTYQSGQNTPYLGIYVPSTFTSGSIALRLRNRCNLTGSPYVLFLNKKARCGLTGYTVTASPNPTSELLTVQAKPVVPPSSIDVAELAQHDPIEVILVNSSGETVFSDKLVATKLVINVVNFPNGQYLLKVLDPTAPIERQIWISH